MGKARQYEIHFQIEKGAKKILIKIYVFFKT